MFTIDEFTAKTGITLYELHKEHLSFESVCIARKCYPLMDEKRFLDILIDGFRYAPSTCAEWIKMCMVAHDLIEEANRFVPLLTE